MIHEVDDALRALVQREALDGATIEVVFDAPTKDWAGRRSSPTIDIYLYDIREDLARREYGSIDVTDDTGRVTARQAPPRRFKLSYLLTAWTARPEDEHRLLSSVLGCFLAHSTLPKDDLRGPLHDTPIAIPLSIGLPPPADRGLADIWSALGGELKPSLDLVVVVPFETGRDEVAGPPVTEVPRLSVRTPDGVGEDVTGRPAGDRSVATVEEGGAKRRRKGGAAARAAGADGGGATGGAGEPDGSGEAAATGGAGEAPRRAGFTRASVGSLDLGLHGAGTTSGAGTAGGGRSGHDPVADELVIAGSSQRPGRILRIRSTSRPAPRVGATPQGDDDTGPGAEG